MFEKLAKWKCLVMFKKVRCLNNLKQGWVLQKKSWCSCSLTKLQNHSVLWMVNCGWPAFLPVRLLGDFLASLGSFYYLHFYKAPSGIEYEKHLLKSVLFVLCVSKQVIFICWSSILRLNWDVCMIPEMLITWLLLNSSKLKEV